MRLYAFTNYYLSPLQKGLQTAHVVAEVLERYKMNAKQYAQASVWAEMHKTIIILNGGNHADLNTLYEFLNVKDNPYPFAKFNEDEISLANATTCVGIILPEEIYEAAALLRTMIVVYSEQHGQFVFSNFTAEVNFKDEKNQKIVHFLNNKCTTFELDLIYKLNSFGLAT